MKNFTDYESMAMLDLPEEERNNLKNRFEAITEEFSKLDKYNTSGIKPLVTVLELNNIMREDEPVKSITRDALLENAPEHHDGYFQVPATID